MEAIILLGGPGAGKGTLAEGLKKETIYTHVSTGDMLRAAIYAQTPVGMEAKKYMDAGELVPDSIILGIIEELVAKEPADGRFMFDGFPRTVEQAEGLEKLFSKYNGTVTHVFCLEADRSTLLRRLTGRRVCKTCGAVYHITTRPPVRNGICDIDGGELYQRADDAEETITNRLEVYKKQTAPLIDWYRKKNVIVDIDAGGSAEKTLVLVLEALKT